MNESFLCEEEEEEKIFSLIYYFFFFFIFFFFCFFFFLFFFVDKNDTNEIKKQVLFTRFVQRKSLRV